MKNVDRWTCDGGCGASHEAERDAVELPLGWVRISAWVGDDQGIAQDVDIGDLGKDCDRHYCDVCQNLVLISLAGWRHIP